MRKGASAAVAMLCAAVAAAGLGAATTASAGASGKQLVIGMTIEKTGILSVVGPSLTGAQKAVTYINSHGGVFGHPVKLDWLDNASDPSRAVQDVKQLAASKVSIILGGAFAENCYAETATVAKVQVPDICLAPDNLPSLAPPYQYGVGPASSQYDATVYKYFLGLGDKNVGVLVSNDAQGQISTAAAKVATSAHSQLTTDLQSATLGATSASSQLQQMMSANVQAIYLTDCSDISLTAAQEAVSLGFNGPVMLNDCFASDGVAQAVKGFVNGKVLVLVPEVLLGPPYTPQRRAAEKLYEKVVGTGDATVLDGWDSIFLAVAAAKKAGSTNPKVINNTLQHHFTFFGTWAGGTFTPRDHRGQVVTGVVTPAAFTSQGGLTRVSGK